MFATVDDDDYDRLSQHSWSAVEGKCGAFYASWGVRKKERAVLKVAVRQMQRDVLDPCGVVSGKIKADHKNGDTLDCRRENLRWATAQQNSHNRRRSTAGRSGYKGVYFDKRKKLYLAKIYVSGRSHYGGMHDTPEAAAKAYDQMAIQYQGEFARLNIVGE